MISEQKIRVLIIEDHPAIAQNIADFLDEGRFELDFARDGLGGLHLALTEDYDVIVLDLMLPGMDGITQCRRLREEARDVTPILMLTARDTLDDKLEGFRAGTDDYLTKPFALEELEMRLEALGRRTRKEEATELKVGELRVHLGRRQVLRQGQEIRLGPIPYQILLELLKVHPNVLPRKDLERAVWPDEAPLSDALRSHVANLRRVLDRPFDRPMIETVHGVGFRLRDPS